MFVADGKRLTAAGAKHLMATAIGLAEKAGVAVTVAIADAGGNLLLLERMEAVAFTRCARPPPRPCARRPIDAPPGRVARRGQALDLDHAIGLALAAGAEHWTAMEGRRVQ